MHFLTFWIFKSYQIPRIQTKQKVLVLHFFPFTIWLILHSCFIGQSLLQCIRNIDWNKIILSIFPENVHTNHTAICIFGNSASNSSFILIDFHTKRHFFIGFHFFYNRTLCTICFWLIKLFGKCLFSITIIFCQSCP